ncbi:MAG: homoserine dehydrogenase [Pseudomonadales bacterium]|jgi:homoserine dehydrogenase
MNPLRVGLAGIGTVGQGVLDILGRQAALIARRAGRPIVVTRVASRSRRADVDLGSAAFSQAPADLVAAEDVDVVVELMGGTDAALDLTVAAIASGRPVVTANKAVIARHGNDLLATAQARGVPVLFEAAVAGAIPIVGSLRHGLAANAITSVAGIINGTSNFILSAMSDGADFVSALAEAQRLGYAEADPTFDIEGIDAAHKLAILAALAFEMPFAFPSVHCEGISGITPDDLRSAARLGYAIKHLGIARQTGAGIELRVHPTLVPKEHMIAHVNGVMNAVLVQGDAAGDTLYCGPGAGSLPTASAVVADLIEIARGSVPSVSRLQQEPVVLPIAACSSAYFLRIPSLDRPGAFARVATLLGEHAISIASVEQRGEQAHAVAGRAWIPIVIVTERVQEHVMNAALAALSALPDVVADIVRIRVEDFTHD